ncbi:hypothetical protein [Sutterella sp.]|uniref:5-methylcytosine restriction system specificity protein McrC n=1 Tax=Sutterella sp. TaxID=1981025 RepID=UPI0026E023DF|nr:hypothetical protein [Sutterella sp.]MDO5531818.1 hypothetical protein [Sutterella sp.]
MLAYAFGNLNPRGFRSIETERFENVADLSAEILAKGVAQLLKRGIGKDYVPQEDELAAMRGRIVFSETLRGGTLTKKRLVCGWDEFSVNSYMNRIIRTTLNLLVHADIAPARKRTLRRLAASFAGVEPLEPAHINWRLNFNRNNYLYRTLMSFCRLVIEGLLMTQRDGSVRVMDFLDDQAMHRLYEKFLLEYFRQEFPGKTSASWIRWQFDELPDEESLAFLPVMRTDITLSMGDRVLIIDAKYYEHATVERWGQERHRQDHLEQIYGYVNNYVAVEGTTVSGLLLYAKPEGAVDFTHTYPLKGGKLVELRTLDLNCEFSEIRRQLNAIAEEHFGCVMRP